MPLTAEEKKERQRIRHRKYREEHREEINARNRAYKEEHKEKINARNREYMKRHRRKLMQEKLKLEPIINNTLQPIKIYCSSIIIEEGPFFIPD